MTTQDSANSQAGGGSQPGAEDAGLPVCTRCGAAAIPGATVCLDCARSLPALAEMDVAKRGHVRARRSARASETEEGAAVAPSGQGVSQENRATEDPGVESPAMPPSPSLVGSLWDSPLLGELLACKDAQAAAEWLIGRYRAGTLDEDTYRELTAWAVDHFATRSGVTRKDGPPSVLPEARSQIYPPEWPPRPPGGR